MITLRDLKDNNIKLCNNEDYTGTCDSKYIHIAVKGYSISEVKYSQEIESVYGSLDWSKVPEEYLDRRLLEISNESGSLYITLDYNREDD